MRQYAAPSNNPVRYDPVIISNQNGDATSNFKEYETQVLAMAVNTDDCDDLQIDYSAKNHAFSLDNVSYITHKENGNILKRLVITFQFNFKLFSVFQDNTVRQTRKQPQQWWEHYNEIIILI